MEAAAPEPPPPPPAEPEREFDITKCAAAWKYFRFFMPALHSRTELPRLSLTLLSRLLACAAARSYSITITLGVVFVLSKLAGSLGLIN